MALDMTERVIDFLARHVIEIGGALTAMLAFLTSGVVLLAFSVKYKARRFPLWWAWRFALHPYDNPDEAYRRPGALLFGIFVAGIGLLVLLAIVLVRVLYRPDWLGGSP